MSGVLLPGTAGPAEVQSGYTASGAGGVGFDGTGAAPGAPTNFSSPWVSASTAAPTITVAAGDTVVFVGSGSAVPATAAGSAVTTSAWTEIAAVDTLLVYYATANNAGVLTLALSAAEDSSLASINGVTGAPTVVVNSSIAVAATTYQGIVYQLTTPANTISLAVAYSTSFDAAAVLNPLSYPSLIVASGGNAAGSCWGFATEGAYIACWNVATAAVTVYYMVATFPI